MPHDLPGLIARHGGRETFAARLDTLFTADPSLSGRSQPDITGLIGQYAHGNEPSHHVAYLYNHAGQPWKTQARVREIIDTIVRRGYVNSAGRQLVPTFTGMLVTRFLEAEPAGPSGLECADPSADVSAGDASCP